MGTMRVAALAVAALLMAVQASAQSVTYKYYYPASCDQIWSAVKTVLADNIHYDVKATNDKKMNADFKPKHEMHVDVTGLIFQRENHARLSANGAGCEMDVVSSYSGFEHDDQGDFKKRVDDQSKVTGVSASEANKAPESGQPAPPASAPPTAPPTQPAAPATSPTEPAAPTAPPK